MKTFEQFINENVNMEKYPHVVFGLANERKNRENCFKESCVSGEPLYSKSKREKIVLEEHASMLDEIYDGIEKRIGNAEDIVFIGDSNDIEHKIIHHKSFNIEKKYMLGRWKSEIDSIDFYTLYYESKFKMIISDVLIITDLAITYREKR